MGRMVQYRPSTAISPNQQQIRPSALVTGFVSQHVQRQGRQIVGHRVDVRVFFLRDDLQVALAAVALAPSISCRESSLSLPQVVHTARGTFHSLLHRLQCR